MAFVFLDKRNVIIGTVVLIVIFVLGIIIGCYSGPKNEPSKAEALVNTIMEDQFSIEAELIKEALESVNSGRHGLDGRKTVTKYFWASQGSLLLVLPLDSRISFMYCFKIFFQEYLKTTDHAGPDDLALVWNFDNSCFSSTILQRSSFCHQLLPKVSLTQMKILQL